MDNPIKISDTKHSFIPFISIGIIAGGLLSWLVTHLTLSGFLNTVFSSHQKSNNYFYDILFFYWIIFYGFMFLLAYPAARSTKSLIFITLIFSFLAAGPYCLAAHTPISLSSLMFFSAYALNAFHIDYQTNGFRFSYQTLFHAVWDTFVKLCISVFFTLLCWIILFLCGQLFKLIGINFISKLLSRDWFEAYATTLFMCIGLYVASLSSVVIYHCRKILLLICKYLLIPLAIISIIFIIAALFSIQHYRLTFSSQFVFSNIAFLSVLFLNGVYQDGSIEKFYSSFLFWICRIFLWITPIFTILALYALLHDQHNTIFGVWRFSSILNLSLLLIYNLVYAVIAIRPQKPLFKSIQFANVVLAIFLIVVTFIATIVAMQPRFSKPTPYHPVATSTSIKHDIYT